MRRAGVHRLDGVASFAEMDGVRTDVSHLQHPAFAKFTLQSQVPLLSIGDYEVSRNFEDKQILRAVHSWPGAATVSGRPIGVRETRQPGQAGQPRSRERPRGWYGVGIRGGGSGEEVGHVESRSLPEEDDRDKRRLEAE